MGVVRYPRHFAVLLALVGTGRGRRRKQATHPGAESRLGNRCFHAWCYRRDAAQLLRIRIVSCASETESAQVADNTETIEGATAAGATGETQFRAGTTVGASHPKGRLALAGVLIEATKRRIPMRAGDGRLVNRNPSEEMRPALAA